MIDSCEEGWVEHVVAFIDKFYRKERRTAVRVEALNYLGRIVAENSLTHEVMYMQQVPKIAKFFISKILIFFTQHGKYYIIMIRTCTCTYV